MCNFNFLSFQIARGKTHADKLEERTLTSMEIEKQLANDCNTLNVLKNKWSIPRPGPQVSGNFCIRNFLFSNTACVHTYPANSVAVYANSRIR